MMIEKEYLERVINRFKASEICSALERWGYLDRKSIQKVKMAGTKQSMVTEACQQITEQQLDIVTIGELEILYTHLHSKAKVWSVFEMTDISDKKSRCVNPKSVLLSLSDRLALYFDADVSVRVLEKALWMRLSLSQLTSARRGQLNVSSDLIYIIHYPRTDFIITTSIKASFKEGVKECLLSSLGFHSLKDRNLKGHCVRSLAELVLYKNCTGSFRQYKADSDNGNPLLLCPRKRKEQEEELDERIVREDTRKRRKTLDTLEHTFGPYVQPALEKVEFKLETHLRGFNMVHNKSHLDVSKIDSFLRTLERPYLNGGDPKPFRCRVKFEGSNVLEGLRHLGKQGLASVPLPKHLSSIQSNARTYFVLAEKDRQPRGLRSPAPA